MKRIIAIGLIVKVILWTGIPIAASRNLVAADCNGNGVEDAIYGLTFLFLDGPPPKNPFPGCGIETVINGRDCLSYPACE